MPYCETGFERERLHSIQNKREREKKRECIRDYFYGELIAKYISGDLDLRVIISTIAICRHDEWAERKAVYFPYYD